MKKTTRVFACLVIMVVVIGLMCITAAAHDSETVKIGIVDITVPELVPGQPFGKPTVAEGCGYKIRSSSWGYAGNSFMEVGNTAETGAAYALFINLEVESNHTFYSFMDSVKVRINGERIYTYTVWDYELSITHTYDFTQQVDALPVVYNVPKAGDVFKEDLVTAGAKGFVVSSWWEDLTTGTMIFEGATFVEGHIYRGVLNIDADTGYSFEENTPVYLNGQSEPLAYAAEPSYAGAQILLSLGQAVETVTFPEFPENVDAATGKNYKIPAAPEDAPYTLSCQWRDISYDNEAYYLYEGNAYYLTYIAKPKAGYAFTEQTAVACANMTGADVVKIAANEIQLKRLVDFGAKAVEQISLEGPAFARNVKTAALTMPYSSATQGCWVGDSTWMKNATGESTDLMEQAACFQDGYYYFYELDIYVYDGYRIGEQLEITLNGTQLDYRVLSADAGNTIVLLCMGKLPADGTWTQENGRWAYITQDGRKLTNCWRDSNDGWRYLGADGYAVRSQWKKDSKGWCYLDEQGLMAQNRWLADSKGWCYVDGTGYCLTNMWVYDSKGPCYIGSDARVVSNQWVTTNIDYSWKYADASGRLVTNKWVKDGKYWYYLTDSGYSARRCWIYDSKGKCYVGSDGKMLANQWYEDYAGWCYLGANGYAVVNGWVKDSKGWCYLGADGYMMTEAWVKDSKGWCYLGANGYIVTGDWVKDGGKWYYLDANGYMLANTSRKIGNKTYHFNASGVCTNP